MQTNIPSPWRNDDPPKDGTVIVALGNLTENCGDGAYNVEPFTATIFWDTDEWCNELGLSLSAYIDCKVTIHHWIHIP